MVERPTATNQLGAREGFVVVVAYAVLCIVCVAVEPLASVPFLWALLPNAGFLAYFVLRARWRERAAA